ncbi:MAG TPA: hypothetical protein VN621_02585 [Arthrobacter sp.]|nr:hypothetical protein [Arthrobacter sp.]
MHVNRLSPLLVAAVALPLLAGCSGSGTASGIKLLEQPATGANALPPGGNATGFQPGSARFAARVDGLSYYVARALAPDGLDAADAGVCLVVPEEGMTVCGLVAPVTATFPGHTAMVVPDVFDPTGFIGDGWNQAHRNVLIRSDSAAK